MSGLTEIDDFSGWKGHHVNALVCAAAGLTELLVEIGGVLAWRDEDFGAALFGMER